jgi:hypothetical protein
MSFDNFIVEFKSFEINLIFGSVSNFAQNIFLIGPHEGCLNGTEKWEES